MQNFFPEILVTLLTHLAVKLAEKQSPALLCLELYLEQNSVDLGYRDTTKNRPSVSQRPRVHMQWNNTHAYA